MRLHAVCDRYRLGRCVQMRSWGVIFLRIRIISHDFPCILYKLLFGLMFGTLKPETNYPFVITGKNIGTKCSRIHYVCSSVVVSKKNVSFTRKTKFCVSNSCIVLIIFDVSHHTLEYVLWHPILCTVHVQWHYARSLCGYYTHNGYTLVESHRRRHKHFLKL